MNAQIDPNAEMVRMEYYGPRQGAVTFHGRRRMYRFGNNAIDRFNDVNPEDVETLLNQPNFRVIGQDAQKFQSPGVAFIPEPSGEVVREVVREVVQEIVQEIVPEVVPEVKTVDIPLPSGESFTSSEGWTDVDLAGPPLDIEPLPGTVKEIKKAVMGADLDTLLAWLKEEQRDKQRKTALEAIENALDDRYP